MAELDKVFLNAEQLDYIIRALFPLHKRENKAEDENEINSFTFKVLDLLEHLPLTKFEMVTPQTSTRYFYNKKENIVRAENGKIFMEFKCYPKDEAFDMVNYGCKGNTYLKKEVKRMLYEDKKDAEKETKLKPAVMMTYASFLAIEYYLLQNLPKIKRDVKYRIQKESKPKDETKRQNKKEALHIVKLEKLDYEFPSTDILKSKGTRNAGAIYQFVCECWGVRGHYRHYKNGKTVFIKPYEKGKKRNQGNYIEKRYVV